MADYILSCCTCADLTAQRFKDLGVETIGFHYTLNGVEREDDCWQSLSAGEFYETLRNGAETSTAQVNIAEYLSYFGKFLSRGLDVVHICLSSGISGTYNAAKNAANIAAEQYPDRHVYVVDSLCASSGFGFFVDALAAKRDEGLTAPQLTEWAEANKKKVQHWFFSTDLSYYVRGGRISRTAGIFGGVFHICPLLHVDDGGHLKPQSKIRGKERVIREIVKRMQKYARDGANYNGKCFLCQSACRADAQAVADLITAAFPHLDGKPEIFDIGATIGSHTGPDTVALFFWGQERTAD